jgi:trans-aconitate methyltransferase
MARYHRYVFDDQTRSFVGRFDEMYSAESADGFDSWHQDDTRHLTNRIAYAILDGYAFGRVADIGCGKGMWIHRLKKANTQVTAIDLSASALKTARARYPDIEFVQADVSARPLSEVIPGPVDLITCIETLSYIRDWRRLIRDMAGLTTYCLIALYLPCDPTGFVRSEDELQQEFSASFDTIEEVRVRPRSHIVLFGRRASPQPGSSDDTAGD